MHNMHCKFCLVFWLLCSCWFLVGSCIDDATIEVEDADDNTHLHSEHEEFVPTYDWQVVKPGQAIPKGLHVRTDLKTGLTEARLLHPSLMPSGLQPVPGADVKNHPVTDKAKWIDKITKMATDTLYKAPTDEDALSLGGDKTKYKYSTSGKKRGSTMASQRYTVEEIQESLKNFKFWSDDVQSEEVKNQKDKQFRSLDELKKDFKDMNMNIKTELEIVRDLFNRYKELGDDPQQKLKILADLEFYLHQIDNACNFVDMGGLDLLMTELNSSSLQLRSEAAFVLGSALQSNPKVQVWALDHGILTRLLRMVIGEHESSLLNRVLYAVSSLIRQFPFAQSEFFEQGGLQALDTLFNAEGRAKLQVRAITLLGDLYEEKVESMNHVAESDMEEERKRQYHDVPLVETVLQFGWCQKVLNLLSLPDHNHKEKVLHAVEVLDFCHPHFRAKKIKHDLEQIEEAYRTYYEQDDDPDLRMFYQDILNQVRHVKDVFLEQEVVITKTEL